MKPRRILLGLTGSVATIRASELVAGLRQIGSVQAVATAKAQHFLSTIPQDLRVYRDEDEWQRWRTLGDAVLHIELRRWADLFVIAPLSANTLAKLAAGICDNLLLSVARAWDYSKPFVIAPAMNTLMWEHPCTAQHLTTVSTWGMQVVPPVSKRLACAEVGMGAMASVATVVHAVDTLFCWP